MVELPPGQRAIAGFPRFGTDLERPPPTTPPDVRIEVTGDLMQPTVLDPQVWGSVPSTPIRADFHCVAGWTARDLSWEGRRFSDIYRQVIQPRITDGIEIRYVVFVGADGYRSIVQFADACGDDVILADRLDGAPLSPEHGAPVRLVSPSQYGYISTKHLVRIELYRYRPVSYFHPSRALQRALLAVHPHPRARVAHEERHRFLPSWLTRRVYRLVRLPAARDSGSSSAGRSA